MRSVLHVGCGAATIAKMPAGFRDGSWSEVRFDINPGVCPDIVGTIQDMHNVGSGSVDALYSSHNVEHVFAHEVPAVFAEFRRVLKPDGFAVVTCPDIESVAPHIAAGRLAEPLYVSPSGPITPLDILYGHGAAIAHGETYMAHRTAFAAPTLTAAATGAGFAIVGTRRAPASFALWMVASKGQVGEEGMRALMAAFLPPA